MDEFFKIKSEVNGALCNVIDGKIFAEKFCQIIDLGEKYIDEMVGNNFYFLKICQNCGII